MLGSPESNDASVGVVHNPHTFNLALILPVMLVEPIELYGILRD